MNDPKEQSALLDLDERIDTLASDGDFEALAGLLADDFQYIHSTGHTQTRLSGSRAWQSLLASAGASSAASSPTLTVTSPS